MKDVIKSPRYKTAYNVMWDVDALSHEDLLGVVATLAEELIESRSKCTPDDDADVNTEKAIDDAVHIVKTGLNHSVGVVPSYFEKQARLVQAANAPLRKVRVIPLPVQYIEE